MKAVVGSIHNFFKLLQKEREISANSMSKFESLFGGFLPGNNTCDQNAHNSKNTAVVEALHQQLREAELIQKATGVRM